MAERVRLIEERVYDSQLPRPMTSPVAPSERPPPPSYDSISGEQSAPIQRTPHSGPHNDPSTGGIRNVNANYGSQNTTPGFGGTQTYYGPHNTTPEFGRTQPNYGSRHPTAGLGNAQARGRITPSEDYMFVGIPRREYERALAQQQSWIQYQKCRLICGCISLIVVLPIIIGLVIWASSSGGGDDCGDGCYDDGDGYCVCD